MTKVRTLVERLRSDASMFSDSHVGQNSGEAADEIERLQNDKDGAYAERNQCVALIARMVIAAGGFAGMTKTDIPGWSEDWHSCVFINLPTGQVSWHFHDSHEWMFADIPRLPSIWDGHDTPEKYRRVNEAFALEPSDAKS